MADALSTEQVWLEFSGRLRRFIARQVRVSSDVEDILQDVFLRIHRGLGKLEDGTRLAPWLFRIARNSVLDHYRRSRPRSVEMSPAQADNDLTPEVASWLEGMANTLPEPYREAVVGAEFQGLTRKAVAERLGLSLSGAKSRVQRGRALLRKKLLECCHLEFDRAGYIVNYTRRLEPCCQERRRRG